MLEAGADPVELVPQALNAQAQFGQRHSGGSSSRVSAVANRRGGR